MIVLDDHNLNTAERVIIADALKRTGSIVEAAHLLGITRHALKRRIIKHNIRWLETRTPGHLPEAAPA